MTATIKKSGLPTPIKVILIIFAVLVVGVIALCATGYFFFKSKVKTDPKEAAEVLTSMVETKQPLDDKYEFQMAGQLPFSKLAGSKVVIFRHHPEETQFFAGSIPKSASDGEISAEQIIGSVKPNKGSAIKVDKKGQTTVGGQAASYCLCTETDAKTGVSTPVYLCTIANSADHVVCIVATASSSEAYDQKAVDQFVHNISAVK